MEIKVGIHSTEKGASDIPQQQIDEETKEKFVLNLLLPRLDG